MYDKGIPFNEAFKIMYKKREETCRISTDINGDYELQIYCGGSCKQGQAADTKRIIGKDKVFSG